MGDSGGSWIGLFSGGKDSSWALYEALERGLSVGRLVTVHPRGDSYMYHVPATDVTVLAAESIGIPLVDVRPSAFETDDAGARGDAEIEPLEAALVEIADVVEGGVAGVIAGAVESEFQTSRIEAMCERLDVDLFAPLWKREPSGLAREMLSAGLESRIVGVAADGLDDSWLGRTLDEEALSELDRLNEERGVHVLGEGGEYETLVTDGPHMDRRIRIEYLTEWDGTRGRVHITDAWLD